jgi:1,4-dihydroxy-2-naphthoate octaprenyltransferase
MAVVNEIFEIFSTSTEDEGADGSLGIDSNGKLYWNKKEIITKQEVSLNTWVNISIVVGAISTLVLAVVAVIDLFNCQ